MNDPLYDTTSGAALKAASRKKDLETWLDEVDYTELATGVYVPSTFAIEFVAFVQLVNGVEGESHKSPPMHLAMLDKIVSKKGRVANLCFRGAAKTTLFFEYLTLYIAFYGCLPDFGDVSAMIYVSDTMENGVATARKNLEYRWTNSEFCQKYIPFAKFTDKYIEFRNQDGHRLAIKMFGAATGIRGTKMFGKRPVLAILDDLLSDDDAKSKVAIQAVKDTIHKGIEHALDPTRRKIIFSGTPFSKEDPLVGIIESGSWDVNVWPVCERFPCTREEFVGAWGDRFSYDYVLEQYENAEANSELAAFYQELMLRITSDEERLVLDSDIQWYSRKALLERKSQFNFYLTTDFATSDKQKADDSVLSQWAYNNNGDWFWVDGVAERMTMDLSINHLFRLQSMYRSQSVGVEVTGQQQAYIKWLQQEMMTRNIWFNFASSEKSGEPGIRPITNKLSRFNLVVPLFKAQKIYFPEEMRNEPIIQKFLGQIKLATRNGLKGKDDCIDTVSMLMYLNPWKPSEEAPPAEEMQESHVFGSWNSQAESTSALDSYIV